TTLDETKQDSPAAAPEVGGADDAPEAGEDNEETAEGDESDGDSDDGWITPSNLKKHVAKDQNTNAAAATPEFLQAALLTTDFAMQNVALRINLHLLSPTMYRI